MFEYSRLTDPAEIMDRIQSIHGSLYTVLDVETTDVDPTKAELIDIQMSTPEGIVCFGAEHAQLLKGLPKATLLIGQNLGYDLHVLYRHGIDLLDYEWNDTMLMHHLDDERESHSLSANVVKLWGDNYKDEFWAKYKAYQDAPQDERDAYGCKDIYYTLKWYTHLTGSLYAQGIPSELVSHVHKLARHLLATEIKGVQVDKEYLMGRLLTLHTTCEELKPKMRQLVNTECQLVECDDWIKELNKRKTERGKAGVKMPTFSFDSPKQLCTLLYQKLGLPEQKNEKTKSVSADYDCLQKIKDLHPVVPLIQEYREHHKTVGTLEGILERMVGNTIYPTFHVNGTKTGRISHADPNLGNMPSTGGIRGIFLPDSEELIVSADYGQLEVCLAAHFSQDKALLAIVLEGASQHDITAEGLKIPRDLAKTINFAMQYRCSHFKVAKLLGVSLREGQYAWNKYWETYSGLKALMDECDAKVNRGEPIITLYGRRRRFEHKKRQPWDKAFRQAFNALIQGTGGDMTSEAFYLIADYLGHKRIGRALWTVHDEVLVSTKRAHVEETRDKLTSTMLDIGVRLKLTVPLKVECSEGMERWED